MIEVNDIGESSCINAMQFDLEYDNLIMASPCVGEQDKSLEGASVVAERNWG